MDVEGNKITKRALFYALTATFLLIAGLITAIIILSTIKSQKPETPPNNLGTYTSESMNIYETATTEILEQAGDSINDIIAMYRVYIEKTTDGGAKALLSTDYYMTLLSLDTSLSMKDEIINGLIIADNTIKNASSALAVSNAANYYQDNEIFIKYQNIAKNRMEEPE
ncbi:hypothetical protein IJG93_04250 [Candidatus Saccharibacteria bacterium]|nr:hypothetical protein [Candidatus Saccharibacteria bacterium]